MFLRVPGSRQPWIMTEQNHYWPCRSKARFRGAVMNPIIFAMRHPITVMVAIVAVVLGAGLAVFRMPLDIFQDLNTPVIYVAQPYGGVDPPPQGGLPSPYYKYLLRYSTAPH